MAETKPSGEQIRFISGKTGEHILADYLEACERTGIPLFDLIEQIFDVDGNINTDFVQFRVKEVSANNYQIQMRLGPNVDPEANWVAISDDVFNDILTIATTARDQAVAAEVLTNADAIQTAADRVQTGLDVIAAGIARSAAEAAANGMKWRPNVKAATTANITLSAPQTIDTVSIIAGDRVLVKNQSTASQNGVYICAAGAWTRATDADTWDELVGQVVITEQGSQADTPFICTIDPGGTLGTNNVTWTNLPAAIADGSVTGAKLGAMTSSQLRGALSDETGTGVVVFNNSPTLLNPLLRDVTDSSKGISTDMTGSFASAVLTLQAWMTANRTQKIQDATGTIALTSDIAGLRSGLVISNNVSDANNDIDIAVGAISSSDGAERMVLASALTKRLDAAWAVGTNQGGLDTGSKANSTWYHLHVIKRTDTNVVDVLFSTSATSPTLPTNYTKSARIGSVQTDGSGNIRGFVQTGDFFEWKLMRQDYNGVVISTTSSLHVVSAPLGVSTQALLRVDSGDGTDRNVLISSPLKTDEVSDINKCNLIASSGSRTINEIFVVTDTSSQVRMVANASTVAVNAYAKGWRELW